MLPAGDLAAPARLPGILLGLLGLIILLQLVPLPPAVWTRLPERAGYMQAAAWLGQPQPWRPLSIVPVLTCNSLLALLPAGVTLIAASRLDRSDLRFVVVVLLGCGIASALLGAVQVGSDWGYLFSRNSPGLPTGVFANRNHQAAFLAGLLPLLGAWAGLPGPRTSPLVQRLVAGAIATLFVITVLITGSRTGLLLTIIDLAGAGWIFWRARPRQKGRGVGRSLVPVAGLAAALAMLVGAAIYLGRGGGVARFETFDAGAELRVQAFPVVRHLVAIYLPWGSGFGTFDPLYRIYEPDALLNPTYFNNAHNDLMELALTGGVPALLLLAALLGWMAWHGAGAARRWWAAGASWSNMVPVAALMMAVTWLVASLPDYPLRTPLAGASFALACCLLPGGRRTRKDRSL